MNRGEVNLIAAAVARSRTPPGRADANANEESERIARGLADALEKHCGPRARFDRVRFLAACGADPEA